MKMLNFLFRDHFRRIYFIWWSRPPIDIVFPRTRNVLNWKTSSVKTMASMFSGAKSANPDTDYWDTSKVTDMKFMFYGAVSANPQTAAWEMVVLDVSSMFDGAVCGEGQTVALPEQIKTCRNRAHKTCSANHP